MNKRFFSDSHTHSKHSFDGNDPVMMLCEQAIKLGLYSISITDHCECNEYFSNNVRKSIEASVMASGKARASYGFKIKVYTGIELGQPTQNKLAADDVLSLCDYDFVIGSLHNLKNEQDFYFLEYNDDNVNDLLERYFTQLYELAVDNRFDTLAHMTYPLRYIVGNVTKEIKYDTYKEMIDEVLKVLVKNEKALEINTSGLRQRIGITLPGENIVSRFRELGGKYITIGSDAHRWGDVGSGLEEGYRLAQKCGFSYVTVFEKRQPVLLPID